MEDLCQEKSSQLEKLNERLETVIDWEEIGCALGSTAEYCLANTAERYNAARNLSAHVYKEYKDSEIENLPDSFHDLRSEIERADKNIKKGREYFSG